VTDRRRPRLAVLADDLIWATRLSSIARAAGAEPVPAATLEGFAGSLTGADAAIVDLALRGNDPDDAIAAAGSAGVPIVAVGPHEDLAARKRALAAGATRVFAYSKLFEDGPRTIAAWLGLPEPVLAPARPVQRDAAPGGR
jgi:hypothetical protein